MATSMRSDSKSLSAVSDALGLGASSIDFAYTAMHSSVEVVTEIKAKRVAAREPGVDRGKVQSEIDALQDQLRSIALSASFAGENWLGVDTGGTAYNATEFVVSSFSRSAGVNGSQVNVGTLSINISASFLLNANTDGAGGVADCAAAAADALGILGSARLSISDADTAGVARGSIDAAGTIVIANFDPANATVAPAEIEPRQHLGKMPAQLLLCGACREPKQPALVALQPLGVPCRYLFGDVRAAHADQQITVGHAVDDLGKAARLSQNLAEHGIGSADRSPVAACKLLHELVHCQSPTLPKTPNAAPTR